MRSRAGAAGSTAALLAAVLLAAGCSGAERSSLVPPPSSSSIPSAPRSDQAAPPVTQPDPSPVTPPDIGGLGSGFVAFPNDTDRWVNENPDDPRTPRIRQTLAGKPSSLWLTGDESFGNLREYTQRARQADGTMTLVLYNIPQRWDGLSQPSDVTLDEYRHWVSRVADGIGDTRALIVLEPDALWFYDRLPSDEQRDDRMTALRFAVTELRNRAPNARVYVEAGTASGSVTPRRMAELVRQVGVGDYAVNVSSYAPADRIGDYAQQVRAGLQRQGVRDPRYVVDTGRNGAEAWDNTWCNPAEQRLGETPGRVASPSGQDFRLWVKTPGTSDGDCGREGAGAGSVGGEFLPEVAYRMIS